MSGLASRVQSLHINGVFFVESRVSNEETTLNLVDVSQTWDKYLFGASWHYGIRPDMASKNKQNSRCGLTLGNKGKTGTLYPSFAESFKLESVRKRFCLYMSSSQ